MFLKKLATLFLICFCLLIQVKAQNSDKKTLNAYQNQENITIDGLLNESSWENAEIANEFIEFRPIAGEIASYDSEVKVLYDNQNIYIGAQLFDPEPDKIHLDLSPRDNLGNGDWFAVTIDTYNSGLNGVAFFITASGVQTDLQITVEGEDSNWNAVWESNTSVNEHGWIAEIKIPYSALRFPETDVQTWGINFSREIRRIRETSYWNPIIPDVDGIINQSGILNEIKNIKPPIRLSFTPFIVGGVELNKLDGDNNNSGIYGAGLDMKLGINDAFTLDMTLIPDFSQVLSDNEVLNLGPFEVFFDENRQFFTEGTDLFNKVGLFYSRRVGGRPVNASRLGDELSEFEVIDNNPSKAQLLNAAKVSGRNSKGLGVGIFNAVENRTYGTIRNIVTGNSRKVETNPFTNYSVFVLDQNLKNNSYVSLVNTNVLRQGNTYDANVTGTEFRFRTADQNLQASGNASLSQIFNPGNTDLGFSYNLRLAKIKGLWQYELAYGAESENYNPNDLGFLFSPNEHQIGGSVYYINYNPGGNLSRIRVGHSQYYSKLWKPNNFVGHEIYNNVFFLTKDFVGIGLFNYLKPIDGRDYFEPRTSDFSKFYRDPALIFFNPFISTNYSKQFAIDIGIDYAKVFDLPRHSYSLAVQPRVRFGSKISAILELVASYEKNDEGFVNKDNIPSEYRTWTDEDILFGVRDRKIYETTLNIQYIFNNKMSLNTRLRHYWDQVKYDKFGTLGEDGRLDIIDLATSDINQNPFFDQNFKLFTLDANFIWRFAPGSDIILNWKSRGNDFNRNTSENFRSSLQSLYKDNYGNSLTLKVLYFLDALYLQKEKPSI